MEQIEMNKPSPLATFVIVITYDHRGPSIYGGYDSIEDAERGIKKIKESWDEYEWRHHTSITVETIKKGV